MKKLTLTFCVFLITYTFTAQENTYKYMHHVETLDSTLETLYAVISGEKGEERDWELFKYLFKPEAKLIPTLKNQEGVYVTRYMSPSDYIKSSGEWLIENGFFEKEIHRTENSYNNITQVFSTYESFHSKTDSKPFTRGINSIQLLNDGERWWIINIYWSQETEETPIPLEYLPKD
jgi:hypothetical protein